MKKLTLLLHEPDRDTLIGQLKSWGVVHVQVKDQEQVNAAVELMHERTEYQRLIDRLNGFEERSTEETSDSADIRELKQKVAELIGQEEDLIKQQILLQKQFEQADFWGFNNKELFDRLAEDDIHLRCFVSRKRNFSEYDFLNLPIQVIYENKAKVYFVLVEKGERGELPFEEIHLPDSDANELKWELGEIAKKLANTKKELQALTGCIEVFQSRVLDIANQLEDMQVTEGFGKLAGGKILQLTGWIPAKLEQDISSKLENESVAWSIEQPDQNDKVPVQLHNSAYTRLFEPITRIFQLPHYFEMDLTPFIAVFYPIFFAYCLGDAGYGLILLTISIIGMFTFLKSQPGMATLGLVLGAMTTLMGIIKSGSVFGIATLEVPDWPFLGYLSRFVIIPDDQSFVFNAFNVAIMIGIVQIFTAIFLSIYKKWKFLGFVHALSPIGKLLIVCATLVWFLHSIQEVEGLAVVANYVSWVMMTGILLFVFFSNTGMQWFARLGNGFLPLFFVFTNMLGDILSYVRLFALGVASSVLGLVVNQIGMQIWDAGWWGWIVALIFLVFGHSLNMGLAILGAFVHPLRLTFVEFYNNAGFEGGGIAYRPYKTLKKEEILTNN